MGRKGRAGRGANSRRLTDRRRTGPDYPFRLPAARRGKAVEAGPSAARVSASGTFVAVAILGACAAVSRLKASKLRKFVPTPAATEQSSSVAEQRPGRVGGRRRLELQEAAG